MPTAQAPVELRAAFANSPKLMEEARGWLSDCEWRDTELLDSDERDRYFKSFPDSTIVNAIEAHYDGGVAEFVRNTVSFRVLLLGLDEPEPEAKNRALLYEAEWNETCSWEDHKSAVRWFAEAWKSQHPEDSEHVTPFDLSINVEYLKAYVELLLATDPATMLDKLVNGMWYVTIVEN